MDVVLSVPPKVKVLEALGCIGDRRINVLNDREAIVISSDGTRRYYVYLDLSLGIAYSDDNGTKFRRYVGYPIIAFLMLKNIIPYREDLAKALAGIPWKHLNETYKNYSMVERIVLRKAKLKGVKEDYVYAFVEGVLKNLSELRLRYYENPPKTASYCNT